MTNVRVRFAPSPTGHLHIGGLRTALFNWLFAAHHDGQYFVRIEDTDQERSSQVFIDSILQSLAWADVTSPFPIVMQSDRFTLYRDVALSLIKQGKAYRCFCVPSPERVGREYLKYDGRCRALQEKYIDLDQPYAIRFKFPLERKEITFHDLIRGSISFPSDQFDDFIIVRSDGIPVYNFVVVVDDGAMNITHVIRGEDHIPNTPKQILLYEALELAVPYFAHVPLIVGQSGQPLSKRDAATSVEEYRMNGYLPEALCNYLVRLGWAHGDQEIFSRQELIRYFSLDGIGKSAAVFDQTKLDWLNGHYIKESSNLYLWQRISLDVDSSLAEKVSSWQQDTILHLIALYKDRVKTLKEFVEILISLYDMPFYDKAVIKNMDHEKPFLVYVVQKLSGLDVYSVETITNLIKAGIAEYKLKFAQGAHALRYALTGATEGPQVAGLIFALGRDTTIQRINQLLDEIKKSESRGS